jgi:hypothetical protein
MLICLEGLLPPAGDAWASMRAAATEFIVGLQHLFGTRANSDILGQVYPPNRAGRINQKFSWTRNVGVSRPSSFVQKIVTPHNFSRGIGKKSVSEAHLLTMPQGHIWRVNADRDYTDAA